VPTGLSVQAIAEGSRPFGLYVPTTYDTTRVWPVTFLLHGYGVSGEEMAVDFQTYAESAGVVVIAPNSYSNTWDLFQYGFGTDVAHINNVLTWAFQHIAVDLTRLSISGFSDGGTYSLWLGLKNGDLFTRIAAMSPCTANVPSIRYGNPTVFISHGTDDTVAPIDQCSRVTVPVLQADGYSVEFVEYPSPCPGPDPCNAHFVPPEVLTHVMTYLSQPGG
jgi:predicted esterase